MQHGAMAISVVMFGSDGAREPALRTTLGEFCADNQDGCSQAELDAMTAELVAGRTYRMAGFVGCGADISPA